MYNKRGIGPIGLTIAMPGSGFVLPNPDPVKRLVKNFLQPPYRADRSFKGRPSGIKGQSDGKTTGRTRGAETGCFLTVNR